MLTPHRKPLPFLGVLVLVLCSTGAHAGLVNSSEGIQLVSEDGHGLLLAFSAPAFSLEQRPDGSHIRIPGWVRATRPGAPDFPVAATLIQLPAGSKCRASLVRAQEMRSAADNVARVAAVATDAPPPDPHPQIQTEKPVIIRGTPFVRLLIHPFGWDEANRTVTYWQAALIRVEFVPDTAGPTVRRRQDVLSSALATIGSPYPPGARIRIEVNEEGFYEVSSQELEELGFDVSRLSPRNLQLWNDGQQVAFSLSNLRTSRRRILFDLRFYAAAIDSPFTATNVYWLCRGPAAGKRMSSRDATPDPAAPLQTWFDETTARKERHVMWELTPQAPDVNYWFWQRLTATVTETYSIRLSAPVERNDPATLKIWFRGRSTDSKSPNHHVQVRWDASVLGDVRWDDRDAHSAEFPLAKEQLTAGDHVVTLALPGDTGAAVDVLYLDRFQVQYGRSLDAGSNDLSFRIESLNLRTLQLHSLSPALGLYDVTDPTNVVQLQGVTVEPRPDGTVFQFGHPQGAARGYYFATQAHVKKPASMIYWTPEGLRNSQNQADHLIIAPAEFKTALEDLRAYRQNQGLHSRIVTTEEIFNEFSDGFPEPEGIREFLRHAYHNWSTPAPRYVLLVGDATYDYRDYLKAGKRSRVPAHLSWTSILGLAPDDHWYACLDGDDPLPDLMIGRLPGATAGQVAQITGKILQFEGSGGKANPKILTVADNGAPIFEETSEKLVGLLPPYFIPQRIYLGQLKPSDDPKSALIEALSGGPAVASYVGHGATRNWAGEFILESADIPTITNTVERLSFVLALDCLNAYFALPSSYSLGEELVAAPGKAAVTCFAPSALSFPEEHQIIGMELFRAVFKDRQLTIGNAVVQAKINAYAQGTIAETLLMFTLLGDPATRLKEW